MQILKAFKICYGDTQRQCSHWVTCSSFWEIAQSKVRYSLRLPLIWNGNILFLSIMMIRLLTADHCSTIIFIQTHAHWAHAIQQSQMLPTVRGTYFRDSRTACPTILHISLVKTRFFGKYVEIQLKEAKQSKEYACSHSHPCKHSQRSSVL